MMMSDASSSSSSAYEEKKQVKDLFIEFLNFEFFQRRPYREDVELLSRGKRRRLLIDFADFQTFSGEHAERLLNEPGPYVEAFNEALQDYVASFANDGNQKGTKEAETWFIGFTGTFPASHQVTPRTLSSSLIQSLVSVQGIVTKASLVRPKMVKSVHYCPTTQQVHTRRYRDISSATSSALPTSGMFPRFDEDHNPLEMEYGWSVYQDHQTLTVQEMPERAPAGQLPRSVDIIADNDLVGLVKPGDRVEVVGVYRAIPTANKPGSSSTKTVFRTVLVCSSVKTLQGRESFTASVTEADIRNIQREAESCRSGNDSMDVVGGGGSSSEEGPTIFERLSRSLAPSIFGHDYIKKALLLLLIGGNERNLANGTHLRGDINILMVGDPSTAKSQLLRFVLNIAPLAISTSGRGSSGVGLTAAVTTDEETGERRLEAGAMVLADRGVVCIDEFDKMSEEDRVAIHEVMEQQTVTIAKAGIHTSLNARCSVVAAANPIYGQYDRQKKPAQNIRLPDSLLSRFDLLFIVLDELSPEHDRRISEHVLGMHMYRPMGLEEGTPMDFASSATSSLSLSSSGSSLEEEASATADMNSDADGGSESGLQQPAPVYQTKAVPNSLRMAGKHAADKKEDRNSNKLYSFEFIKRYIIYAKNFVQPELTVEATEYIGRAYTDLRSKSDIKTLPITARTLETLIRLSVAHAKCRLSSVVTEEDAAVAVELVNFALYHEAIPRGKKKHTAAKTSRSAPSPSRSATGGHSGSNGGEPATLKADAHQTSNESHHEEEEEEDEDAEGPRWMEEDIQRELPSILKDCIRQSRRNLLSVEELLSAARQQVGAAADLQAEHVRQVLDTFTFGKLSGDSFYVLSYH
ncbi:MCM DNA helicase complex subunit [Balamuthia mandrillaris]